MSYFRFLCLSVMTAGCCLGQWSLGGAAGFSFYPNPTITTPAGSAEAGFTSRLAAGAVLGQNVGNYFGGELRYTFLAGDSELRSGGRQIQLDAIAHAVHYDVLVYATSREHKLRPYIAAGGGIKYFVADGDEYLAQPLSSIALLTHTNQVEGLFSTGAGIKFALNEHVLLRVDFRYYLTPFPDKLFVSGPGTRIHGWLQDFVPLGGIDWTFGK